jgi:hypothetical protein
MLNRMAVVLNVLRQKDDSFGAELIGLVDAVDGVAGSGVELSESSRALVDELLLQRFLTARGSDVAAELRSLTNRASDTIVAARLARYLDRTAPAPEGGVGWSAWWRPHSLTEEEIAEIRTDAASARVAEAWVATMLADATSHYEAESLLGWLGQFGFDLEDAFIAACERMRGEGRYLQNAGTIVQGALAGNDPPYEAVFEWIEEWHQRVTDASTAEPIEGNAWQAELDYAHQLHLQDRYEEESAIVKTAVEGYVRARRRRGGYAWIRAHRRHDLILSAWADAMLHAKPVVTAEEIDAYFVQVGDDERLRVEGLRVIGECQVSDALEQLHATLRTGSARERRAAVHALSWLTNRAEAVEAIRSAMNDTDEGSQIDLLLSTRDFAFGRDDEPTVMDAVAAQAPSTMRDVFAFAILVLRKASPADQLAAFRRIDPEQVVRLIDNAPLRVAGTLLSIAAHEGYNVAGVAERWLESDDEDQVSAGVDALARLGTVSARARIASVLEHEDYKVRRFAMSRLAARASDEEKRARPGERK